MNKFLSQVDDFLVNCAQLSSSAKMKGGISAEEVRDMRATWMHVLARNLGDFSAGFLLEYVLFLFTLKIYRLLLLLSVRCECHDS